MRGRYGGPSGRTRSRTARWALGLALAVGWAASGHPVEAQVGLRLGFGPAYAEDLGAAGTVAVRLRQGGLLGLAEVRGVSTGRVGDWEGSARVVSAGVGAGIIDSEPRAAVRRYVLGTVGAGVDPREGDGVTTFAAAVGIESTRRRGLFGELRLEGWRQRGIRYHDLPSGVVSVVVGLSAH